MLISPNNKIILGTVQFGLEYGVNNKFGKPTQENVRSILDYAFEKGICLLDTAEIYGNAQNVIGDYHSSSNNVFKIITKFSSKRNDLPTNITERIHFNLKVLKVNSLYCYMFHSLSDFKLYYPLYKTEINKLQEAGIISKLGVSVYSNEEVEELLAFDCVDLVQFPFNLLDNNYQRADLLNEAKKKGIEIHTRSVFLQGLFFMDNERLPQRLQPLIPRLNEIREIAKSNNLDLHTLSLNYVLQQHNIDHVLIGVDNVFQLQQNVLALQQKISPEIIRRIDSIRVSETTLLNPSNWN